MAESTITRPGSGDTGPGDPRPDADAPVDRHADTADTADADTNRASEPHVRWITRRRLAKWNAPRHPRDWRWFVAGVGRTLIATGLLLFGFVAYQLWGTGIETARSQRALTTEFEALLATTAPPVAVDTSDDTDGADGADPGADEPATRPEPAGPQIDDGTAGQDDAPLDDAIPVLGPFEPGDPVARIEIPRIDLDRIVVSGVGVEDLKKGPGHFPTTSLPGHLGNAAIAGHRTTHGQPFRNVDDLEPGDEIVITTLQGTFVYLVTGTQIVSPQDSHVVATTRLDVAELTLVSCHPVLSAAQRIVVSAELDEARSSPTIDPFTGLDEPAVDDGTLPGEPDLPTEVDQIDTDTDADADAAAVDQPIDGPFSDDTTSDEPASDEPADDPVAGAEPASDDTTGDDTADDPVAGAEVDDEIDDAFARGWFHDPDAYGHIALWGALLTLVSLLAYGLSRLTRRDLVGFVVGVGPFTVAAFFFFQNVNRLLPPGL